MRYHRMASIVKQKFSKQPTSENERKVPQWFIYALRSYAKVNGEIFTKDRLVAYIKSKIRKVAGETIERYVRIAVRQGIIEIVKEKPGKKTVYKVKI